jgi:uncharacterized protein YnzC (UPF0291/DUF896 family)
MLPKDKMDRINELARKSKECALDEGEKVEQDLLRKEYIAAFRESFIQQLENIEIVDGDPEDCKPKFKN